MNAEKANPFENHFLEVITKHAPKFSEILGGVSLRSFAGREFLVGVDVQENSFRKGLEVWILMDEVSQIALSYSTDDLNERMQRGHGLREE